MFKKLALVAALSFASQAAADHSTGSLLLNHQPTTLDMSAFNQPVLITGVPSFKDAEPGVVSVTRLTANTASLAFKEWDNYDGVHGEELVPYLIFEKGRYEYPDGTIIEAGQIDLSSNNKFVLFQEAFPEVPKLYLTAGTNNANRAFNVRSSSLTRQSFKTQLNYAESVNSNSVNEIVNYVAVYAPNNTVDMANGDTFVLNSELLNHMGIQVGSKQLFIQEEQSKDQETVHVRESVSILRIGESVFATDNSSYGGDTYSLRSVPLNTELTFTPGEQTGERGNIALNGTNGLTTSNFTASSTYSTYIPAAAFDGYNGGTLINSDTRGKTNSGAWLGYQNNAPQWLQVSFAKTAYITGFKTFVYTGAVTPGMSPRRVTLQVSDDNINFHDHETFTLDKVNENQFTLLSPAKGKHIRLVVHATHGHNAIVIGELEYYGQFIENDTTQPPTTEPSPDAITCASIKRETSNAVNGTYYVEPSNQYKGNGFQAYCNMTELDGGWTLVANHQDGLDALTTKTQVLPAEPGVLTDMQWRSIINSMQVGIMTIDEHGKIAFISKDKLLGGNCVATNEVASLTFPPVPFDVALLWHDEVVGCSSTGLDYSYIALSTKHTSRSDSHLTVGASLYQHGTKFDIWPYTHAKYSGAEQNQLLIYVK